MQDWHPERPRVLSLCAYMSLRTSYTCVSLEIYSSTLFLQHFGQSVTQKYCHLCRSSRVSTKGKYSCTFPWVSRKAGSKAIYIPAPSLPIHIFRIFQISFQLWASLSFLCLLLSSWDFSDLLDCQGYLLLLSYNYCLSCVFSTGGSTVCQPR